MTREETWKVLARWIQKVQRKFNLHTIDELLSKLKELQSLELL